MDRGTRRLALALMLCGTAALYMPGLAAPFVYEDPHWMAVVDQGGPTTVPIPGRALSYLTLSWTVQAFGYEPYALHVGNLALHLLNGVLVYAIGAALVSPVAALLGAGLFLIHPINSQAVNYLAARTDLVMTTCILLAVWAALSLTRLRVALALLALVAAAMSKELGLVGVPLVLVTLLVWRPQTPWRAAVCIPLWISCGGTLGVLYPWVQQWLTMTPLSGGADGGWYGFLALQTTALWSLLTLLVRLDGFSIDHDVIAIGVGWRAAAVVATGLALALIAIAWDRCRPLVWMLAWVALAVAPRFVVPTAELLSEHHLYLAMPGIALGLGVGAMAWWGGAGADSDFWRLCREEWRVSSLAERAV